MSKKLWYVMRGDLSMPYAAPTIHSREDVRELGGCGWEATLYGQADGPVVSPDDIDEVVVCRTRPFFWRIYFEIALIARVVRPKHRPAFVLFRGTGIGVMAMVLYLARIPFGVELPGPPPCFWNVFLRWWRYPLQMFPLRYASAIVVLTKELADLVEQVKHPKAIVAITGVGVNTDDYVVSPTARKPVGDGPVLGFLGTIYADRGLKELIETITELDRQGISARLVVVGDGRYRAEAEGEVARLNIADRVEFKGFVPPHKVSESVSSCDLMVALYPRTRELTMGGINPMKVWTSLAVGKAILLFNPGQFNQYDGVPGIFACPENEPTEVARRVAELWNSHGRTGLAEVGSAGRRYVNENVTWHAHASVIDKTICQAMGDA